MRRASASPRGWRCPPRSCCPCSSPASSLLLYCGSELDSAWHALRGRAGHRHRTAALLGLAVLLLGAARLLHSARRVGAAHRGTRSRLRLLVRLADVRTDVPGATVVTHPEPAAYLAPDGVIVVTSAAVERLAAAELLAVLAHERGHRAGRHYALTRAMRLLAHAFPWLRCFADGRHQVDRLVELCADDAAARTTARLDLARALVALSAPATAHHALSMHGGDAMERLQRLLDPPRPLLASVRAAVASACGLLPVTPLGLALL